MRLGAHANNTTSANDFRNSDLWVVLRRNAEGVKIMHCKKCEQECDGYNGWFELVPNLGEGCVVGWKI